MAWKLAEFIGNPSLTRLLRRAELPPSTLFTGPGGVGKKTLALLLAGLANCKQPEQGDLCGCCTSCVKLKNRNHPDILLIDEAWIRETVTAKKKRKPNPQVIPIDATLEVVREAQYRPFEGKCRFFIIDEAEKMNDSAANSLLKTLEEPPETTRLVLVTAYPEQLLPTIRSRCQIFPFRALSRAQVIRHLAEVIGFKRPELRAAFSGGSIGSAVTLDLEKALADRDLLLELLDGWVRKRSFEQIFRACESQPLRSDLRKRERVLELIGRLRLLGEDLYLMVAGSESRIVNLDRREQLSALAERVSLDWIESFLYHVNQAEDEVRRYVNGLICFETLWLKSEYVNAGNRASAF